MRKVLLAIATFFLTVGLSMAATVSFVKYDEKTKELKVKEGKKGEEVEKTYKITDKTKFFDGDDEIKAEDAIKKMTGEKAPKRLDLKNDDDKATEIKFLQKKKKNDK